MDNYTVVERPRSFRDRLDTFSTVRDLGAKGVLVAAITVLPAFAQGVQDQQMVLENRNVKRVITLSKGEYSTTRYYLPGLTFNFVSLPHAEPIDYGQLGKKRVGEFHIWHGPSPKEFSMLLNGKTVTGKTGWEMTNFDKTVQSGETTCVVSLKGKADSNRHISVDLTYRLYDDCPIVRKKMTIKNTGDELVKLENLDIECLNLPWGNTHNHIYNSYARYKQIGPFVGNWDDPLVVAHNPIYQLGYIAGNEAPGVMKRISVCKDGTDGRELNIGLTHTDSVYPFRSWLKKGESFVSPWVFTCLFKNPNVREPIETYVATFVRKHMGIRLAEIKKRPTFIYNTWEPFRGYINEHLIKDLSTAAAACGIEEFIVDDGWESNFGDWEIDRGKFPHGFKPVFDHMKSLGLKPGLWLSMGAVSTKSKVFREHPEWFIKAENDKFINLHTSSPYVISACFATEWKDYFKGKVLKLVKEHGLEYVKLDFAILTSAYRFEDRIAGCHAKNHGHRDREEAFLKIYRAAWQMFDELHAEAPELFIDCTFETMGKLQLIDFDMCKHAEGDWLSNFESPAPIGSLRIRQMAWWRSSVIPATALVLGNQSLDDAHALYSYKSLCGALPIMLGDPRRMSDEKRGQFKKLAGWMLAMDRKHQIMLFRQDLPGFGEPVHGSWDGFQRINTETRTGGIVGVFKQYSPVKERWVTINYLDPDKVYQVLKAGTPEVVVTRTGEDLRTKGFKVEFEEDFQGELFEVCLKTGTAQK